MKNKNLNYIKEQYLTLEQLSEKTETNTQYILQLIKDKIIPKASYTIKENSTITSPLEDSIIYESNIDYYPKSTVQLIKDNLLTTTEERRITFKTNLKKHLKTHPDNTFAYTSLFDIEGHLNESEFDSFFEDKYQFYLNGVYGICTKQATEEEIIKKGIAVQKLIAFSAQHTGTILNETEKKQLKSLKEEFDTVATIFAPYQRETSSRGKYLDTILENNGLVDLIKQY